MQELDYWKQFPPVNMLWHYLVAALCFIIAIFSLIANIFVLIYLLKYKY